MSERPIYPDNPTEGQEFTVGQTKKVWDGEKWVNKSFGNHERRLQELESLDKINTVNAAVNYEGIELLVGSTVYLEDRKASFLVVLTDDVGSGSYSIESTFDNTYSLALVLDSNDINPEWFGLVYDGDSEFPTDNKQAIDDMCAFLKRGTYPEWTGGKIKFSGERGKCFATSGGHDLPQIDVDGDGVLVRPLGPASTVFSMNTRFGRQNGRFLQNWNFGNFMMWSDTGFSEKNSLDCNHFLEILGGWVILSNFYDIKVQPGFSCKSLINWDLTHTELPDITEIGVPDGITFKNITAQFALNTCYALSFIGDKLGTGSRFGSCHLENVYNTVSYTKDFADISVSTSDFGVVRVEDCDLRRSSFNEIYGVQPIRMIGDAEISESSFPSVYVEFNSQRVSDFESMLRGGTYIDCEFGSLNMYTENSNLDAPPRFFSAEFHGCTFGRVRAEIQSQITNKPDENFIDLGETSTGNVLEKRPQLIFGIGVPSPVTAGLAYTMTKMSLPSDTVLEFCKLKTLKVKAVTKFSTNGEIVIGSLPSELTEINAIFKAKFKVIMPLSNYTADLAVKIGGGGLTATQTSYVSNYSGAAGAIECECEVVGQSNVVEPTVSHFSGSAVFYGKLHSGFNHTTMELTPTEYYNRARAKDDANIQAKSGSYDAILSISNLTGSGGTFGRIVNAVIEYGYTDEYVNYY